MNINKFKILVKKIIKEELENNVDNKLWKELCKAYDLIYKGNHIYSQNHPIYQKIKELENQINKKFNTVLTYPDGSAADSVGDNFTLLDAYTKINKGDEPLNIQFYNKNSIHEEKSLINPKYTHFAILKSNNKIINGWEYGDIDVEDLKSDKEHYFYYDIKDLDLKPKDVKILTRKALERRNINPFDTNNWHKII